MRETAHRQYMPSIQRYVLKSGAVRFRVRYTKPDRKPSDKGGFRSHAAAKAWMQEMEAAKFVGIFVSPQASATQMHVLIDRYVSLSVGLSRNTIAQRKSHARNWVTPKWGSWPVGNITRQAVEQWMEELTQAGAGSQTIRKCHQLPVSVMERAVEENLISRNPVKRVRLPRVKSRRHPYLTFDEVAELASAIDPRYRLFVAFLSMTGLRIGEAAALRVSSIDLERRLVFVEEAITEVSGVLEFGPTKTHERRTVAFPSILDAELADAVRGHSDNDLVFTSPGGLPLRNTTWRRRFWYPALKKINEDRQSRDGANFRPFPTVTPHDLRHTAASLAVKGGASVVGVQRMLGHADAKMTLNTYVSLFTSDLTEVATVLSESASHSTLAALLKQHSPEPSENAESNPEEGLSV